MSEENKDIELRKNISELKEEFDVFKGEHRHLLENIEQFTEKLKKENKDFTTLTSDLKVVTETKKQIVDLYNTLKK